MTRALDGMQHVHEFHVNCRDHIFSYDLVPFLCAAWRRFAPTLRVLSLSAPAGRFRSLLSMSIPHTFPSLQSVKFSLDRTGITMHGDDPSHVLASFINNARSTLDTLTLTSHCDLSPTVLSLGYLPRLRKLSLVLPVLHEEALLGALLAHSETLSDFTWGLNAGDADEGRLEQLDRTITRLCVSDGLVSMKSLGLFITLPSLIPAFKGIQRNLHSLTRLCLNGLALDVTQLRELSTRLTSSKGSALEELKLTVDSLEIDVVEAISCFPPSLRSVSLGFHHMLAVDQVRNLASSLSVL